MKKFLWPLLLLSSGCLDSMPEEESLAQASASLTGSEALAAQEDVPPRADPRSTVMASDDEAWRMIEEAGRTATIGLKAPGARRGIWRGKKLVQPMQVSQARQGILSQKGIKLLSEDDQLPRLTVEIADRETLERVRRLPFVDYVEPARFQVTLMDSLSGCNNNSTGGTPYTLATTTDPVSGDIIPWNYDRLEIQRAWARGAQGQGTTVGVVDTGLFMEQSQLWYPNFQGGWSTGRDQAYFAHYPTSYYDTCNHGTRMAGVVAAPRDGVNIMGVAYRANLRVSRAVDDVYIGGIIGAPVDPIVRGIRSVAESGARAIAMAWGQATWSEAISDEIQGHYYNRDILFFGAAGTSVCPFTGIFPGDMGEVISVTGLKEDNTVHETACGFDTTDIGAVIGETPSTGKLPGTVVHFGGSSNATALLTGVAGLVWSKYPHLNRDQVRDRLFRSTLQGYNPQGKTGWGRVNAFRAVGGFYSLYVEPNNWQPQPGQSVTLTAITKGDGPFTYQWSTGGTGSSTSVTCSYQGQIISVNVTVRDLTDGTTRNSGTAVECGIDPCDADPSLCEPDPCDIKPWLCD
ncbi:S8 family peptidase [Hyalangium gracile]|uniref:S8 family peptidase n=1 Tax=Hyalangium gracile TaxID=394092 RepID=UPI001CCAC745|nr:S8/S53 family peptidase [Hyalangium gracile]